MYSQDSKQTIEMFEKDPEAFLVYHHGYQAQVKKWEINPTEVIISWIKAKYVSYVFLFFDFSMLHDYQSRL